MKLLKRNSLAERSRQQFNAVASSVSDGWHNLFMLPLTTVVMKLFLLLVAIYSLIFYQQHKIEKSRITLPGSESKAGKSYQDDFPVKLKDFGSASFLIRSHFSITPGRQIARLGLNE